MSWNTRACAAAEFKNFVVRAAFCFFAIGRSRTARMEGLRLPPSPRERPPPGPSPRGKGIGASPERDAAARRSLTSSLTSSRSPRGTSSTPGTTIGDWDGGAATTTSEHASAYYESSANLLRYDPDATARGSGAPAPGAGARRSIETFGADANAVDVGLGRVSLGLSTLRASFNGTTGRDVMRASTESGRSEVDTQTADVLARQQAQLSDLNEQLRSLQSQLGHLRRSGPGEAPDDTDGRLHTLNGSSRRWGMGESTASAFTVATSRDSVGRFSSVASSGASKKSKSSDAATNTVWAAPEPGVDHLLGLPNNQGHHRHPIGTQDTMTDEDKARAWKYEGDGRKSRGMMTDPWVGASRGAGAGPDAAGRVSTRMSVIRRSGAPRASNAGSSEPRQSRRIPVVEADEATGGEGDEGDSEGGEEGAGDVPPLPPLPPLVTPTTVPPVRAESPVSIQVERTDGDAHGRSGSPALIDVNEEQADRGGSPGLVPSANSAFMRVSGETVGGGDGPVWAAGGMRGSGASGGAWFGTSDGGSTRVSMGNSSMRWSVGSRDSVSSLAAQAAAEAAAIVDGDVNPNHTHRLSHSNLGPAFQRFPLFVEGDSAPVSPAADSPDAERESQVGEGHGHAPRASTSETDHEDGDEVLRASRDTLSMVSTSQAGSLSLRGGMGGADGDGASTVFDDDYSDSDFDDAGTAVTGTTTGRGADSDWTPPTRWGLQRMSEAAMYDPSGDDAPRKLRSPGSLEDGGTSRDGTATAETRERLESVAVLEGMPTISYQPFSDDEDSEDDEMMVELMKKYGVSAPK